jgi:membrane peptidoglycan carboxypeptidase
MAGASWPARRGPEAVISPADAYLMTSLLEGVVRSGTGTPVLALGVPRGIAGKTGTTNEGRDAWFVGYSSRLVTVVWVGFDQDDAHGLAGAQAAIPMWADFMKQALAAYPAPPFAVPGGITVAEIDAATGKRAGAHCPLVAREVFLTGTEPPPCDEHTGVSDRMLEWERLRIGARALAVAPERRGLGQRGPGDGGLPTQTTAPMDRCTTSPVRRLPARPLGLGSARLRWGGANAGGGTRR